MKKNDYCLKIRNLNHPNFFISDTLKHQPNTDVSGIITSITSKTKNNNIQLNINVSKNYHNSNINYFVSSPGLVNTEILDGANLFAKSNNSKLII